MDITWHQSKQNENLFRCLLDGKILLGYVVKSAAPLLPSTKSYAYWANNGSMFNTLAAAQAEVLKLALEPKLD